METQIMTPSQKDHVSILVEEHMFFQQLKMALDVMTHWIILGITLWLVTVYVLSAKYYQCGSGMSLFFVFL